jgi:hypothetical protein
VSQRTAKAIVKCNTSDLPDNIIGAAVLIEHSKIPHAGLFIRYNGESKLFHFDGEKVLLEDFKDEEIYFFKELPYLKSALTASFLAHCQVVLKEAKPVFGYFYIGALYDEQGKFRNPGDLPEYMTCVGFCLNFLRYFADGVDLFEIDDWKSMDIKKKDEYVTEFIEKVKIQHPNVDIEDFKKGIRRIWPAEYFTGAFSETLPVKKEFIDANLNEIQETLLKLAIA